MRSDHVEMSVIVWSSVLDVEAFLGRITDIATCLPDIESATLSDAAGRPPADGDPGRTAPTGAILLVCRGSRATISDYELFHTHGRTGWRLSGPVDYAGTISFSGDASVTQLRSTLTVGAGPSDLVGSLGRQAAALVNSKFLRELARRIETGPVAAAVESSARHC